MRCLRSIHTCNSLFRQSSNGIELLFRLFDSVLQRSMLYEADQAAILVEQAGLHSPSALYFARLGFAFIKNSLSV